jgi:glycosyltransferase involved in cell wall biosynthesis
MGGRIPYLVILTSSNQLYSGTGTALFEWIRYAKTQFDFAICIDNRVALNYMIARDFCRAEEVRFLPCGPDERPGAADPGVADAQLHAASGRWPVIEVVSWANTATNLDVVEALCPESKLVFTPHTQPNWTMPGSEQFWLLDLGFDRVLARADLVCCDSPAEVESIQQRVTDCPAVFFPIAVDTSKFCRMDVRRDRQVLIIADFFEPRKRTDLALSALARLLKRNSDFRAVIGGRGSDEVQVPPELEGRIERLGYVTVERLVHLYQSSAAYLMLSDYEAFCIPIVESLACGTPVIINSTSEMLSLYSGQPGCYLVPNANSNLVDRAIDTAIADRSHYEIASAVQSKFGVKAAFAPKVRAIQQLLTAKNAQHLTRQTQCASFM